MCLCIIFMSTAYNVVAAPPPGPAPTGIVLDMSDEIVTGVSTLMEYSTNGTRWSSINADQLNVTHFIPAASARADVTLSIRFRAAGGAVASLSDDIILPRRPPTPTIAEVRFDGITETIAATTLMEYRAGTTGAFAPVPPGGVLPETVGPSSQRFQLRISATSNDFASAIRTVTMPARRAAPNAVYNSSSDRVTSVSPSMEFSIDGGTTWTSVTGAFIPRSDFGSGTSIMVRTKATASSPSSNIKTVDLPGPPAAAPAGITLDFINEIVSGVSDLMEYSTNGSTWKPISANPLNVTNLIPAYTAKNDVTLQIRFSPVSGGAPSVATNITLFRRPFTPATTDVWLDGFNEAIYAPGALEYRVGTTGAFTPVPGSGWIPANVGAAAQNFQIRVSPTASSFASLIRTVSVPARKNAPNAAYNGSLDRITGVTPGMEFSLDGGATWTPVSTSGSIPRGFFGNPAQTVMVRVRATISSPASNITSVSVPAAATTAPAGLVLNIAAETVSGVSNLMEYSTNGSTWKPIDSNPLDISSLIPAANARSEVTLSIRDIATPGAAASLPFIIILERRPPTPSTADLKYDGITDTITAPTTMEYAEGVAAPFSPVPPSGIIENIHDNALAYTIPYTVRIRTSATATTYASAVCSVPVPARPAAPNVTYDIVADRVYGVSAFMEFSIDSGLTWAPITPPYLQRIDVGAGTMSVMIRTKATVSLPVSYVRTVNLW